MVDFALVAPCVFTMLLGIIEYGHYAWVRSALRYAIEEAGRYAMAHKTESSTELTSFVNARSPMVGGVLPTVLVTSTTVSGQKFVTIEGSIQFQLVIPFVPNDTLLISSRTRVPLAST